MPAIDDGAVFAPTRVRSARRPRILAAVVVVAVVGLIAVGALDRTSAPSLASVTTATSAPIASPRAQTARSSRPPPRASLGAPGITHGRAVGGLPPILLDATRHASTISVHGDLLAQQVTRVLVSLQSLDGQVASSDSVSIPAPVGDGRDPRPPLGFDVELAVPTGLATGVLVVQAQAYDAENRLIASTRVRLAPEM